MSELFTIDSQGAYITSLEALDGTPILYQRRQVEGKFRGGCHVCLPQFGPDINDQLDQHGYARTSKWKVIQSTPSTAELTLDHGPGQYQNLEAKLRYQASSKSFSMKLSLINNGDKDLRVSPAFHPYFAISGKIMLDGIEIDTTQYAGTEYIDGAEHELVSGDLKLRLKSNDMNIWALWTNSAKEYFCVEPSLNGQTFATNDPVPDNEILSASQTKSYEFTISWD